MWACTLALSQLQNPSQTLASCLENACPWSEGQNHTSQSQWMEKKLLRARAMLMVACSILLKPTMISLELE